VMRCGWKDKKRQGNGCGKCQAHGDLLFLLGQISPQDCDIEMAGRACACGIEKQSRQT
jgi:hypothetical protein